MKKFSVFLVTFLLTALTPLSSLADTPFGGAVKIKGGTDGTIQGNVGDSSKVNVTNAISVSLPSGASTSAKQDTGNASLSSIDSKLTPPLAVTGTFFQATQPVSGTFFQATQPVSAAALPLPSGAATSANQATEISSLSSIDSKLTSPLAVTGTFFQATQPVSISGSVPVTGPLTDTQLRASAVPVSAASLPLPSGASTSALQSTINTTLGSPFQAGGSIGNTAFGISGTLPAFAATPTFNIGTTNGIALDATLSSLSAKFNSLGQKTMANSAPVVLSSDQSSIPVTGTFFQATQPVSAAALPLPSGAATSALQTSGNSSLSSIDGKLNSLGQKTSANSVPVVIASDQSVVGTKAPINVTGSGSAASATVSTVATLTAPANAVGFFLMNLDTSTTNMRWAVGRTASTTLGQQLQPGRDTGFVPVGANISIIAESGTVNYDVQWVSQ